MSAIDRLYKIDNTLVKKSVNLEDKIYEELKNLIKNEYDASISEMINVILEDYFTKGKVVYYGKPKQETVTYRSVMLRSKNLENLNKLKDETSISTTRLLNGAIKEFIQEHKK